MPFMEREITDKQLWFVVDGNCGTDYVPAHVVQYPRIHRLVTDVEVTYADSPMVFSLLHSYIKDYTENTTITGITLISGYGARLSAPGYLECTDWCVFDTVTEAEQYLKDAYSEDDEDDED